MSAAGAASRWGEGELCAHSIKISVSRVMFHVSRFTCQVSRFMSHLSRFMCHVPRFMPSLPAYACAHAGYGADPDGLSCSRCSVGWASVGGPVWSARCKPCGDLSTSNPSNTGCGATRLGGMGVLCPWYTAPGVQVHALQSVQQCRSRRKLAAHRGVLTVRVTHVRMA